MKDRYNFDAEFDIEKFRTHTYDDILLDTSGDEKIAARREERRQRIARESNVNVITPEIIETHVLQTKAKKKRKIHVGKLALSLAALCLVCVFVATAGLKLTNLQVKKKAAEKQLDALNKQAEQLENELQELDTDEYVENTARSELHMIKEGEVLYIVNEDLAKDTKTSPETTAK